MKAVVYLRVSTDEQAHSGAGLAAQQDACRAHAERAGWGLSGPFSDEGISGAAGLDKRPGLLDAVAQLGRGDVLLVAKRDRLGRDPIAVAMIEAAVCRQGARVVSAAGEGTEGDDPTNVLMRRIVDAFAEYERLVIRARTRSALRAKRARSERVGQVPYGVRLNPDGRTVGPDAGELATLADVRRMRGEGRSLRGIAAELTARGVPTKNGGPRWTHTSVVKILQRETQHAESRAEGAGAGPVPQQPEPSPEGSDRLGRVEPLCDRQGGGG